MQSGRIHLCKVSCIFIWRSFEGDRIALQMKHCFSILLFSILSCHIGLLCLLVCFYYYFCNWSFQTTLWGRISFIIVLSLEIYCACSVLKRHRDYVKTSRLRCFGVKYKWIVCRDLAEGYFYTDVFWKLWLFFYAINYFISLINNLFFSGQYVQCVF